MDLPLIRTNFDKIDNELCEDPNICFAAAISVASLALRDSLLVGLRLLGLSSSSCGSGSAGVLLRVPMHLLTRLRKPMIEN